MIFLLPLRKKNVFNPLRKIRYTQIGPHYIFKLTITTMIEIIQLFLNPRPNQSVKISGAFLSSGGELNHALRLPLF